MKKKNDVLPEGFPDPVLMSDDEIEEQIVQFLAAGNIDAAMFLKGVQFSVASFRAAGVLA